MVLNSDVSEEEDWHGDSTEIALVDYALTKNKQELGKKSKNSRISIRFVKKMHDNNTSNRKGILVITKGAVEVLLDKIDEHQKPLVSAFERKRSSQRRLSGYSMP
jgi:Ca2+-transporting ATPase